MFDIFDLCLYLPPGPGGVATSDGVASLNQSWSLSIWCLWGNLAQVLSLV